MKMYPVDAAAETLRVSLGWLTRLCRDRRIPNAKKIKDPLQHPIRRAKWMVPVDFKIEDVKYKQARKGFATGRKHSKRKNDGC